MRYLVVGDTQFPSTDIILDAGRRHSHGDEVFIVPLGRFEAVNEDRQDLPIGLLLRKQFETSSERSSWYSSVGLLLVRRSKGHRDIRTLLGGDRCAFEVR